ncbi:DUF5058 family protein [Aquibacillus sp. 3ASR75-11]|uniref:DUF5058 family protein n=1 Tax=Terrihalobacillus insolitus TaxID=2950438 RepID=A0A9X3WQ66_9BACI|nr:DUF5058 family protein [Terrihalobacillus insolitus]MDC3413988.1 DUF5058 family protein [Terrihalobacillus insolitus]MDC3424077.1 DUF5058 family protein [Terrihalobacillus insolitus]
MEKVLQTANSFPLWIFALLIVGIVIFQGIVFIKLCTKASSSVGMTNTDVKAAIRAGAFSSLGPSLAIVFVAISFITLIGNPVTLMRIGIIGSAAIETVGASIGAKAAGTDLGSANFTAQAFTTAVWVMCLGGMGWLLFTALFTKSLGKIQEKAAAKTKNVNALNTISIAAMVGAFGYLGGSEMVKGFNESIVLVVAFIVMPIIIWIANKLKMSWLKEWSLGLVIIVGLFVGYFIS